MDKALNQDSLFEFWKLPKRKISPTSNPAKQGIIINDNPAQLTGSSIVELQLEKELKPDWLTKNETIALAVESLPEPREQGEPLAYFHTDKGTFVAIAKQGKKIIFNFNPKKAISYLLKEKYCTKGRPIYTHFPFHYHKIPFRIQLSRALSIHHKSRFKCNPFPRWPEEKSVDTLRYIFKRAAELTYGKKADLNFWGSKQFALCFSHDIDTEKGFEKIPEFSALEKKHKICATYNLLTNYYPLKLTTLENLASSKHEIGWHGYNHDNLLPFLEYKKIKERMSEGIRTLKRFSPNGMRSPCLLTSPNLYKAASKYFEYDSSVPDTAVFISGTSDFSGCCTVFPYLLRKNLLELPLTMPMDADLQYLGFKPKEILSVWKSKLAHIKKVGGLAVLNTHADPHYSGNEEMLQIYEKFLAQAAKEKKAMKTTCAEIAAHWKKSGR